MDPVWLVKGTFGWGHFAIWRLVQVTKAGESADEKTRVCHAVLKARGFSPPTCIVLPITNYQMAPSERIEKGRVQRNEQVATTAPNLDLVL